MNRGIDTHTDRFLPYRCTRCTNAPIFVEATASVSHTQYVLMLKIQRDGAGKEKTGTGGPCAQVSRHDLFVIQH
jgi:hypothetical protein